MVEKFVLTTYGFFSQAGFGKKNSPEGSDGLF